MTSAKISDKDLHLVYEDHSLPLEANGAAGQQERFVRHRLEGTYLFLQEGAIISSGVALNLSLDHLIISNVVIPITTA